MFIYHHVIYKHEILTMPIRCYLVLLVNFSNKHYFNRDKGPTVQISQYTFLFSQKHSALKEKKITAGLFWLCIICCSFHIECRIITLTYSEAQTKLRPFYRQYLNCIFTRGQFWPPGIVVAPVRPSVTKFVGAITHHSFKLGSPTLDQRCKTPWLRSLLFWGAINLDLQGQI